MLKWTQKGSVDQYKNSLMYKAAENNQPKSVLLCEKQQNTIELQVEIYHKYHKTVQLASNSLRCASPIIAAGNF